MPCLCPVIVLSNLPSYAPQIFTVLSAAVIYKQHRQYIKPPTAGYNMRIQALPLFNPVFNHCTDSKDYYELNKTENK